MPDSASVFVNATVRGRNYLTDWSATGDNHGGSSPNVGPAKGGSLTTRTDNTTGTVTMTDSGHGITTGAKVDIYWSGGSRRNVTVGTVSGTSVPISVGSGDNLPLANVAVALAVPVTDGNWAVPGANVTTIAMKATSYRGTIVIRQSDGTEIFAAVIKAGQSYVWSLTSGGTNPVTGVTVGKATFSHEDLVNTQEMPLDFLYN